MKKLLTAMVVCILFFWGGTAGAAQWHLDKAHSEFRFEIRHIFAVVTGHFTEFEGTLNFDPGQLDDASLNFIVKTASVNTRNNKRDTHLRSREFFETDKYPGMTFQSSTITHVADHRYRVDGFLTIKDVQKPMTVEFLFHGPKPHPLDKKSTVAGFETSFDINRLDYHVGDGKFYKLGVVNDTVHINISIEALTKR